MVRIAQIQPESIAADLALEIGSRIVRINGAPVRDVIDFRFLEVDGFLELEVADGCGAATLYEIEKEPGESLGVVPAPDAVRQCANKCVFCFVDGNPATARKPLHVKDDDFRLSFTYGSYVTLTNLGPKAFQRLIDQRLSPLYVSVHATDPAVRMRLLGVALGGGIVDQLGQLVTAGIEAHTQVVLCPGWNDGRELDRTIDDLWALGAGIVSLSIVPVGLTQYNVNRPVRLLTQAEAGQALAQVERGRERALRERAAGWVYAADEFFFLAGSPIPPAHYYDDWPLTENGVGSVRRLLDDFEPALAGLARRDGQRLLVVTGTRMAPVLTGMGARVAERTGAEVEVVAVANGMFGPTVTTAGLLPGADIAAALRARGPADSILIPAECLNDDDRFVDEWSLEDLRGSVAPARVLAAHELAAGVAGL